jgi:DNA topoisomerase-3
MEKLYNKGYLSYPRTETTKYNPTIDLRKVVNSLKNSEQYGAFAAQVASGEMWQGPRNGKLDDKAHPPIHPVKQPGPNELNFDESRVYDLLARHFLASIAKDAQGSETTIRADMGGELFSCYGLIVEQQNWLEVFHFEKWQDSVLPAFHEGQRFKPVIALNEGKTQAPSYLTEADLIDKMDKHGIGTDATIHEHIKNI